MVDYNITIKVETNQATVATKTIERSLNSIENAANKVKSAIYAAFSFAGLSLSISTLARLSDAYTQATNRVRLVTSSTAELNVMMRRLAGVAEDTGVKYEEIINVYQRTRSATVNLGLSQQDLLNITRGLAESAILSGTNMQKMNFGLSEVAQAMGQATFNGRQLRVIINDIPVVAQLIVNELNKVNPSLHATTGSLKELGSQGQITNKLVVDAIQHGLAQLDKEFQATPPTIERALQTLRSSVIDFIGGINRASGIQGTFSRAIVDLSKHLDELARIFAFIALVAITRYATAMAETAYAATLRLFVLIATNPLGALVTALGFAAAAAITFGDKVHIAANSFSDLQDLLIVASHSIANVLEKLFDGIINKLAQIWHSFTGLGVESINIFKMSFQHLMEEFAVGLDELAHGILFASTIASKYITPSSWGDKTTVSDIWKASGDIEGNKILDWTNSMFDQASSRALKRKQDQIARDNAERAINLSSRGPVTPGPEAKLDTYTNIVNELKNQNNAYLILDEDQRKIAEQRAKIQARLKESNGAFGSPTANNPLGTGHYKQITDLLTQGIDRKDVSDAYKGIYDKLVKPSDDLKDQLNALDTLFKSGKISIDQYNIELGKIQNSVLSLDYSMGSGFKQGVISVTKDFEDLASVVSKTVVDAFKGLEDTLTQFAITGKLNVKNMVDSILADLVRLQVRQYVTAPIASLLGQQFGQQSGGSATSTPGLLSQAFAFLGTHFFADGDVFNSPTAFNYGNGKLGVLGEAGPETILPLGRNSSGQLGVRASGMNSAGHTINIQNTVTVNGTTGSRSGDTQLGNMMANKLKDKMEQTMTSYLRTQQRTGGQLSGRNELS